jgi:hypothetical protein
LPRALSGVPSCWTRPAPAPGTSRSSAAHVLRPTCPSTTSGGLARWNVRTAVSVAAPKTMASAPARAGPTGSPPPTPTALSFSCSSETAGPCDVSFTVGWVATPGRACGVGSPGLSPGTGLTEPLGCRTPPGAATSSCAHVATSSVPDGVTPLAVWNFRTASCVREPNSASIFSSGVAPRTFSFCWATPTCWSMSPSRKIGRVGAAGAVTTWRAAMSPATAAFPAARWSCRSPTGGRATAAVDRPFGRCAPVDTRWTPIDPPGPRRNSAPAASPFHPGCAPGPTARMTALFGQLLR